MALFNDILGFSGIEAGTLALDPVEFHLRDTIKRTLAPLVMRATQKGINLRCEVNPDVPDTVIGDVVRLRQIVVNLVGNPVKFTEQGEVAVLIHMDLPADETATLRCPEVRSSNLVSATMGTVRVSELPPSDPVPPPPER